MRSGREVKGPVLGGQNKSIIDSNRLTLTLFRLCFVSALLLKSKFLLRFSLDEVFLKSIIFEIRINNATSNYNLKIKKIPILNDQASDWSVVGMLVKKKCCIGRTNQQSGDKPRKLTDANIWFSKVDMFVSYMNLVCRQDWWIPAGWTCSLFIVLVHNFSERFVSIIEGKRIGNSFLF